MNISKPELHALIEMISIAVKCPTIGGWSITQVACEIAEHLEESTHGSSTPAAALHDLSTDGPLVPSDK